MVRIIQAIDSDGNNHGLYQTERINSEQDQGRFDVAVEATKKASEEHFPENFDYDSYLDFILYKFGYKRIYLTEVNI